MIQPLNHSDNNLNRSGSHAKRFVRGFAQTPLPTSARSTTAGADHTRLADRNLQAMRATSLSLHRWAWARPQTIFVNDSPNWRTSTPRVCAERYLPSSRRVSCQLPHTAGDAQRDLCNQCRASASPRESRLNGPRRRSARFCQGGRHHRQHDRILSRCGRHATQRERSRPC